MKAAQVPSLFAVLLICCIAGCRTAQMQSMQKLVVDGDTCQLMRIHPNWSKKESLPVFHGCYVDQSRSLSPAARQQLSQILRDSLQSPPMGKGCMFMPGYAVHITQGEHVLDLLFCFGCDQVDSYDEHGRTDGYDVDHAAMAKLDELLK